MARSHVSTDTSADAMASIDAATTRNQMGRIEAVIRRAGHGMTILEIERATGIVSSTVSARLAKLRKENRIHESIIRRNCSVNGRRKKLWVVAPDSGQLSLGRTA